MKIITRQLENESLKKEIQYIVGFMSQHGAKFLNVYYGNGVKTEHIFEGIKINTNELEEFIQKSVDGGIFILGKSDLFIDLPDKSFGFQLCHESDVHFKSNDLGLVEHIRKNWEGKGYKPYEALNQKAPG